MKQKYINNEQIHQIEIHKFIQGLLNKEDPGEAACLEWVKKYAKAFREWAETVPSDCVSCGACKGDPKECKAPFNQKRLDKLKKDGKIE